MFPKPGKAVETEMAGPCPWSFLFSQPGVGPEMCISNESPDGAEAAGQDHTAMTLAKR